ncbi:MAG TPA: hypothetical protein DD713_02295 [Nitrospiraceae bacterium]|jgi:hypothetical protein|nr:hypothetical protein [Nitrospiraceae bacterium]
MKNDVYVSTSEAARLLNVCSRTIINYCEQKKLIHTKNDITKRYSVSLASLRRLLKKTCDHRGNMGA